MVSFKNGKGKGRRREMRERGRRDRERGEDMRERQLHICQVVNLIWSSVAFRTFYAIFAIIVVALVSG